MTRLALALALACPLAACDGDPGKDTASPDSGDTGTAGTDTGTDTSGGNDTSTDTATVDMDGDGAAEDVDCDDNDATAYPGAPETCDGVDDDCDGAIDEDATDATTWYADDDGDGVGVDATAVLACAAPTGTEVGTGGDCDDGDPWVHPGAEDLCDGVDNDCDPGTTESGVAGLDEGAWWDLTSSFQLGTAGAIAWSYLAYDELHICGGPWYNSVNMLGAGRIIGHDDAVIDTDGAGPGIVMRDATFEVSVESITLRNGGGLSSSGGYVGAGVFCDGLGGARVTLTDVTIETTYATLGGGVFAQDCDLVVEDSTFQENGASLGAGIYAYASAQPVAVEVRGSTFYENSASSAGGGIAALGVEALTITLDETLFQYNDAYGGGGLFMEGNVAVTCSGTSTTTAGFIGNEAPFGGGIDIEYNGLVSPTFDAVSCDFGADGTADDNVNDDVRLETAGTNYSYDFTDDAEFTCGATGCE